MDEYRIINTDNFGGDYPNEKFVENLPYLNNKQDADIIVNAINSVVRNPNASRFWRVVKMPYTLQPGFEP